jgi:hypothetical protein
MSEVWECGHGAAVGTAGGYCARCLSDYENDSRLRDLDAQLEAVEGLWTEEER